MGVDPKKPREAPVRASEVLSGVLAALAAEQIAQGALTRFHAISKTDSSSQYWELALISILLLLTVVRFFHGNHIYLQTRYERWSHTELQPNAWIVTPLRHSIDVFVHILQYVALVAAGDMLGKDPTFKGAAWATAILFLIDALWVGAMLLKNATSEEEKAARRTFIFWCCTSLIFCYTLIVVQLTAPRADWLPWVLIIVLIADTVIDYSANYTHYFDPKVPTDSVSHLQAAATIAYLASVIDVPPKFANKQINKETLEHLFGLLFGFFMASQGARSELFCRRPALLHVALFFHNEGTLRPVVQYRDPEFVPYNLSVGVGEGYVGGAFTRLRTNPEGAECHSKHVYPDGRDGKKVNKKNARRSYRSSLHVNLFWPVVEGPELIEPKVKPEQPHVGLETTSMADTPRASRTDLPAELAQGGANQPDTNNLEAIGTLVLTSNQDHFFTERFHEALLIGLSGALTLCLKQMTGLVTAKQLKNDIMRYCNKEPLEITTQKEARDHERAKAGAF
jgi:hypothetical protein